MREIEEVDLQDLPQEILVQSKAGKKVFSELPYHLRLRLSYDPLNHKLEFKGYFDDKSTVGDPILLPNVMSDREKTQILALSIDQQYQAAVEALYDLSHKQLTGQTRLVGGDKALTAGAAAGTGYVTLAFANDQRACAPNPVSLASRTA